MLKPADPSPQPPEPPIGDLVHQLIDDAKAYARAEVGLVKAIAASKGKAITLPLGLFAAALFIAMAAINALAIGLVIALSKFIGPLAAGLVGMLIFAAIAGALGWFGYQRLKRAL
jgi:hypothetical protein